MLNLFQPPAGLLGDQEEAIRQQMQMQGLLGLAAGLFQAGTPSPTPVSLGGSALQGLMAGQQMASDTFTQALKSQALRQQIEEKQRDRLERQQAVERANRALYGVSPQEALSVTGQGPTREAASMIGAGGAVTGGVDQSTILRLAADPSLPKDLSDKLFKYAEQSKPRSVDLSENASLYSQSKYGTADVTKLTSQQAADVLAFARAPTIDQQIALSRLQFETGVTLPGMQPTVASQPAVAQPATQAAPATQAQQAVNLNVPADIASKPLGKNEQPIIRSAGISPKQRQQLELERPQVIGSIEYAIDQTRQMRNTVRRLLNNPNLSSAFGVAGTAQELLPRPIQAALPAANILAELDTLRNQSFVDTLAAMRQASKTGAAVGNVTEQEGKRFENLRASLENIQTADQAERALRRLDKELEESETRVLNSYQRTYGEVPTLSLREIETLETTKKGRQKQKRKPLGSILGNE